MVIESSQRRRLVCAFVAGVLILAGILEIGFPIIKPKSNMCVEVTKQVLPPIETQTLTYQNWKIQELSLAETEDMRSLVKERLNYSSYVYRKYSNSELSFSVYIVHWEKGMMPIRLVAAHTPDSCWPTNGWHCVDMRFGEPISINNKLLYPVEWRKFKSPSGESLNVWFWHIANNQPYRAGNGSHRYTLLRKRLRDLWQELVIGDPEQYFVRITSADGFDRLSQESVFSSLLNNLGELVLYKNESK